MCHALVTSRMRERTVFAPEIAAATKRPSSSVLRGSSMQIIASAGTPRSRRSGAVVAGVSFEVQMTSGALPAL